MISASGLRGEQSTAEAGRRADLRTCRLWDELRATHGEGREDRTLALSLTLALTDHDSSPDYHRRPSPSPSPPP